MKEHGIKVGLVFYMLVVISVVLFFSFASKCLADPNNLQFLGKSERKINVTVDANTKKVDTIQYHRRADANDFDISRQSFTVHCFIIDSKEKLKEILLKYGYDIPPVDFSRDLIVYCPSLEKEPQVVRIEVDSITFKEGKFGCHKNRIF